MGISNTSVWAGSMDAVTRRRFRRALRNGRLPIYPPKNGEHAAVLASEAHKIIGNAVPCILAYKTAKNLEEKWPLYFGR